eukprot:6479176-Amphidinium_carterae.1
MEGTNAALHNLPLVNVLMMVRPSMAMEKESTQQHKRGAHYQSMRKPGTTLHTELRPLAKKSSCCNMMGFSAQLGLSDGNGDKWIRPAPHKTWQ